MLPLHSHHLCPKTRVFISLFALTLTLWLGFAVTQHAIVEAGEHPHHHCQLFTQLSNGLTPSLPLLPAPSGHVALAIAIATDAPILIATQPQARDPPLFRFA